MCLLVAHQRCGNLQRAREVLAEMRQKGFSEEELKVFEQELSEPPLGRLVAIEGLIEQKNYVSAEIAARLVMKDFPEHTAGDRLLQRVLACL